MSKLIRFKDDGVGCFANVQMNNGDPCWISVARTGVLVKKSRIGLLGATLFKATDLDAVVWKAQSLEALFPSKATPERMKNPVLVAFTNAVLHCHDVTEVTRVLNGGHPDEAEPSPAGELEQPDWSADLGEALSRRAADVAKHLSLRSARQPGDDAVLLLVVIAEAILPEVRDRADPAKMSTGAASVVAAFIQVCLAMIVIRLRNGGVNLDTNDIMVRALDVVFQKYHPEDRLRIAEEGARTFQRMAGAAAHTSNVKEWLDFTDTLTWSYVLTGDLGYLALLERHFRSLADARE